MVPGSGAVHALAQSPGRSELLPRGMASAFTMAFGHSETDHDLGYDAGATGPFNSGWKDCDGTRVA